MLFSSTIIDSQICHKVTAYYKFTDSYSNQYTTANALNMDVWNKFFKFQFGFGSVFWKNSDSVRNEIGSVPFKKCGSIRIL